MRRTSRLMIVLASVVCVAVLLPLGFASYAIFGVANENVGSNVNVDSDVRFLRGIEITEGHGFTYQHYHYVDEQGHTANRGGVYYQVSVSPMLLDKAHQVDNGNGGYAFSLAGSIVCSGAVFSRTGNLYDYFDSMSIGTTAISPIYVSNSTIKFNVPFNVPDKTTSTTFKLSCLFSNQLLVSFGSDVSALSFTLSLTGGSAS